MQIDIAASFVKVCNIDNHTVSQFNMLPITQDALRKGTKIRVNEIKISEVPILVIKVNHCFFRILTTNVQLPPLSLFSTVCLILQARTRNISGVFAQVMTSQRSTMSQDIARKHFLDVTQILLFTISQVYNNTLLMFVLCDLQLDRLCKRNMYNFQHAFQKNCYSTKRFQMIKGILGILFMMTYIKIPKCTFVRFQMGLRKERKKEREKLFRDRS